jgi:hypothetical protein
MATANANRKVTASLDNVRKRDVHPRVTMDSNNTGTISERLGKSPMGHLTTPMELQVKAKMANGALGERSLEALLVVSVATRLAMAFLGQLEVQFLAVLQKTA